MRRIIAVVLKHWRRVLCPQTILADFFRRAFDGSGADNFYDAGDNFHDAGPFPPHDPRGLAPQRAADRSGMNKQTGLERTCVLRTRPCGPRGAGALRRARGGAQARAWTGG
jgi:hypothetical protein